MALNIKVSGTWREAVPKVKVSGTWRDVSQAYVKVSGVWKELLQTLSIFPFESFFPDADNPFICRRINPVDGDVLLNRNFTPAPMSATTGSQTTELFPHDRAGSEYLSVSYINDKNNDRLHLRARLHNPTTGNTIKTFAEDDIFFDSISINLFHVRNYSAFIGNETEDDAIIGRQNLSNNSQRFFYISENGGSGNFTLPSTVSSRYQVVAYIAGNVYFKYQNNLVRRTSVTNSSTSNISLPGVNIITNIWYSQANEVIYVLGYQSTPTGTNDALYLDSYNPYLASATTIESTLANSNNTFDGVSDSIGAVSSNDEMAIITVINSNGLTNYYSTYIYNYLDFSLEYLDEKSSQDKYLAVDDGIYRIPQASGSYENALFDADFYPNGSTSNADAVPTVLEDAYFSGGYDNGDGKHTQTKLYITPFATGF